MPDWFPERGRGASPWRYAVPVAFALALFATLCALVAAGPPAALERLDAALSALVRAPLSPALDRLTLGATMLGDFPLTTAAMLALVATLLAVGRRALALHALALFVGTKLLVAVVKVSIDRARPLDLFRGGDVYSFPSGHAASACVLFGVFGALFLARERSVAGERRRGNARDPGTWLPALCLLSVPGTLVALSRVRLGAHWPSDVVASLALGTALLLPFVRHARRGPPLPRRLPWLALGAFAVAWAAYVALFGASVARLYIVTPAATS